MIDITIRRDGSIVVFTPETSRATEWIEENVQSESWQWLGSSLAIDVRLGWDLALAAQADGLEVE